MRRTRREYLPLLLSLVRVAILDCLADCPARIIHYFIDSSQAACRVIWMKIIRIPEQTREIPNFSLPDAAFGMRGACRRNIQAQVRLCWSRNDAILSSRLSALDSPLDRGKTLHLNDSVNFRRVACVRTGTPVRRSYDGAIPKLDGITCIELRRRRRSKDHECRDWRESADLACPLRMSDSLAYYHLYQAPW